MFRRSEEDFEPFGRRGRGFDFDGPFRAGRGMMEPAILGALSDKPMHGYEIITHMEEKSHGMWRPSPGSVYPTLQMLEEKGDVKAGDHAGKKVYELTDQGRGRAKEFQHLREAWKESFADRQRSMRDRHHKLGETMKLLRDIYRKGSSEQNEALGEALDTFKKRLEQIKAGEL